MREKHEKHEEPAGERQAGTDEPVSIETATAVDPLSACPWPPYNAFEASDGVVVLLDDKWYEARKDEFAPHSLDETSGAYLDDPIASAMSASLANLAKRREKHLRTCMAIEAAEAKRADDLMRAIEDGFDRLGQAQARVTRLQSYGSHKKTEVQA